MLLLMRNDPNGQMYRDRKIIGNQRLEEGREWGGGDDRGEWGLFLGGMMKIF